MSVTWHGLAEFRHELKNLPDELVGEASKIVLDAAQHARQAIEAAYPEGPTGNLKRGVRMDVQAVSRGGSAARVRSTARHAHLFEGGYRGKAPRRTVPESQQMIPIAIRARRQMYVDLIRMVQAHGLTVTSTS